MQSLSDMLIDEADNCMKMCWGSFISKTDKLNTLEGCGKEVLMPLEDILTIDMPIVFEIMDRMGIPDDKEHRLIHEDSVNDVTMKELNESFVKIRKTAQRLSLENMVLQLFVFVGGHGVGFEQKQSILLNSDIANKAIY